MSDTPTIDPTRTAVVLIEYQNDFTSEGGTLHGAVKDVMDSTGMMKNTVDLVDAARAAGATVMHSPISFAAGYGEISSTPYGILAGVVDPTRSSRARWGAEIVDEMTPAGSRHRHRGQARFRRLRLHQPGLHPAVQGHHHHRAGRVPDQLLRRVDHAHRVREGLPGRTR